MNGKWSGQTARQALAAQVEAARAGCTVEELNAKKAAEAERAAPAAEVAPKKQKAGKKAKR